VWRLCETIGIDGAGQSPTVRGTSATAQSKADVSAGPPDWSSDWDYQCGARSRRRGVWLWLEQRPAYLPGVPQRAEAGPDTSA